MSDNPMDLMVTVEQNVWYLFGDSMEDLFTGSKLSYSITFSDTNSIDLKGLVQPEMIITPPQVVLGPNNNKTEPY